MRETTFFPRKELPFSGVYSLYKGKLQLLTKECTGPNGIAFSPDEKYLYIGNWDDKKKTVYRYEVNSDGTIKNGRLFFDFTNFKGEDAIDGIKVDVEGNLYVSAPGGLQVVSKDGNIWEQSSFRSIHIIWPGATATEKRSTSVPAAGCIEYV